MRMLFLSCLLSLTAWGIIAQTPVELKLDQAVAADLPNEDIHFYQLDLAKDMFVFGAADQITVDVVVTILDPDGETIGNFDGPARGPEDFQFTTEKAGVYQIKIAPFKAEAGQYSIQIKRLEPEADTPVGQVNQLMSPYDDAHTPGVVVGVYKGGELIFAKAYGMANLVHEIPFGLDMPTNIGSVSKQFTAMAILLLQDEGLIDLDDDVREYLPELPDFGKTITIRHLLTHTNGLREMFNTLSLRGWDGEDHLMREEVIRLIQRQPELQNEPGEAFNYNNSAFVLLATIVERITESSFPDWMADHIFQPLGMEHTRVRRHPQEIIPHSTQGYASSSEGWREAGDLAAAYGAGGIYTTAGDLAKWLRNFSEPVVGNAAIIQELTTPFVLNNGDTTSYALGIGVGEYRGLREFSHGGADIAHRAFLAYYPDLDAGVILLSNNSGFSVNSHDITGYFFGDQLAEIEEAADAEDQEPSAEEESWSPSPAELEAYAGTYKFEEVDMLIEYRLEGGKLVAQATGQPALTLTPLEKHAFSYAMVDAKVVFDMQPDGHVEMGTHFQGGNEIKLHRVPAFDPSPEALAEFTGDFYCDELQVIYTLFLEEDKLKARQFNAEDIGLSPTEADTFTGDKFYVGSLAFTRDEAGKVTGFTVSNGRTKGVVFTRQD